MLRVLHSVWQWRITMTQFHVKSVSCHWLCPVESELPDWTRVQCNSMHNSLSFLTTILTHPSLPYLMPLDEVSHTGRPSLRRQGSGVGGLTPQIPGYIEVSVPCNGAAGTELDAERLRTIRATPRLDFGYPVWGGPHVEAPAITVKSVCLKDTIRPFLCSNNNEHPDSGNWITNRNYCSKCVMPNWGYIWSSLTDKIPRECIKNCDYNCCFIDNLCTHITYNVLCKL